MKTLMKVLTILVVAAIFSGSALAADVNLPPVVEKAVESRVFVQVSFLGFNEGYGAGFVVAPNGYVITANHIFSRSPGVAPEDWQILVSRNPNEEPSTAKIVFQDDKYDLALLKAEKPEKIGPPVKFAEVFPKDGETVYFSGFWATGKLIATLKAVILGGVDSLNIGSKILYGAVIIDRQIPQGFSGGPVFNAEGELVGMNSFGVMGGLGGIIALEPIKNILNVIKYF